MDHGRYDQPGFSAGNPILHFHSRIPSLVSEVPFFMQQVLNPIAPPPSPPPPQTFHDTTTGSPPHPPPPAYSPEKGWNGFNGGINLNHGTNNYTQSTTIRWPRQETLALLEIRSRLDPCFKEATSSNHKAPLWDEISRKMNEEYGYQRSGRKCKEKFENLYKYYKKTKEGKVGKHDGKHYRFFRQLESLFGDQPKLRSTTSNNIFLYPNSQSNYSSEYGTPLYEKNERCNYKFKKKELIISAIQESIELQFRKLMAKQDEFSKKILCTIERKEHERVVLEDEWRRHEGARLDQEYEGWASHVARVETRDKSLLDALQNLIRLRSIGSSCKQMDPLVNSNEHECSRNQENNKDWVEPEISSLIHIRMNKECKFQEVDQKHDSDRLWEEVAFEMSLLGYNRSQNDCKETWEKLFIDFNKTKMECDNMVKKEVSLRRSNFDDDREDRNSCFSATAMNIDGHRSWETM